jgi:hypothetical protein
VKKKRGAERERLLPQVLYAVSMVNSGKLGQDLRQIMQRCVVGLACWRADVLEGWK